MTRLPPLLMRKGVQPRAMVATRAVASLVVQRGQLQRPAQQPRLTPPVPAAVLTLLASRTQQGSRIGIVQQSSLRSVAVLRSRSIEFYQRRPAMTVGSLVRPRTASFVLKATFFEGMGCFCRKVKKPS